MVGKLAPNSAHSTRELVRYVPGWGYFRTVPSQNGDKHVTSPLPPNRWTDLTYVNVLRPPPADWVFCYGDCSLIVFKQVNSLIGKFWLQEIQHGLMNNAVFAPCAMATYSASLVERVTQCCVVLLAFTTVPPTITATPDTERLYYPYWRNPRLHTRRAFGRHPLRTRTLGLSFCSGTRLFS